MVYEPLYHAREIETIKLSSASSCKVKSARSSNISCSVVLIKKFFYSRLLDMRWSQPTRRYAPWWLSIILYPTHARGIIVNYCIITPISRSPGMLLTVATCVLVTGCGSTVCSLGTLPVLPCRVIPFDITLWLLFNGWTTTTGWSLCSGPWFGSWGACNMIVPKFQKDLNRKRAWWYNDNSIKI